LGSVAFRYVSVPFLSAETPRPPNLEDLNSRLVALVQKLIVHLARWRLVRRGADSDLRSMREMPSILHNGANIRRIQKWLGHHSLDVTLAYLADEDDTSEPVREQVNSAFSAFT
jgi:hypothetical protein